MIAHSPGASGGSGSAARYFAGGAWGASRNLTAEQAAQLALSQPGPTYVWTDGMPSWAPAQDVPEVASALARLGSSTVDSPGSTPSRDIPRRKVLVLGASALVTLVALILIVLAILPEDNAPPPAPAPPPPPAAPAAPKVEAPPPPPAMQLSTARADRPSSWSRIALKDSSRRHGSGTASSELREANGVNHPGSHVGDVKGGTAWCESASDDGIGEWVELSLSCGSRARAGITGLAVRAGYGTQASSWIQNNRVAMARVTVERAREKVWEADVRFLDAVEQQYVDFNQRIDCEIGEVIRARLRVQEVYEGQDFTDTCVSTMAFYVNDR